MDVIPGFPGGWPEQVQTHSLIRGTRPVDLVFSTRGERTTKLALRMALQHIGPRYAYVFRDASPLALGVERQMLIHKDASHVVYVEADSLILEDMRSFLDGNDLPLVNCYSRNRFWGWVKGSIQIVRMDVLLAIQAMLARRNSNCDLQSDSHRRSVALKRLGLKAQGKNVHILEEYFQHPEDVFTKFAERELCARTAPDLRLLISQSVHHWGQAADFMAARRGLNDAASLVPLDTAPADVDLYRRTLRTRAREQVRSLSRSHGYEVRLKDVTAAVACDPSLGPRAKAHHVFGLGLSRTGTRSLTEGLHVLGFDTVHYPVDPGTLRALVRGDLQFPALDHYMGLTDITICSYYEDMDRRFPDSKFVLTTRDEETWLASCRRHWDNSGISGRKHDPGKEVYRQIQVFLRTTVYGTQEFDSDSFRRTYRRHAENVRRYFSGRRDKLLILDLSSGEGFTQLAPFLGAQVPHVPFPHIGKSVEHRKICS